MKAITFLSHVAALVSKDEFNQKFVCIGKVRSKHKREIFLDLLKMGFTIDAAMDATDLVFQMTVKSKMTSNDILKMAIDYRMLFDLWDGNIQPKTNCDGSIDSI